MYSIKLLASNIQYHRKNINKDKHKQSYPSKQHQVDKLACRN